MAAASFVAVAAALVMVAGPVLAQSPGLAGQRPQARATEATASPQPGLFSQRPRAREAGMADEHNIAASPAGFEAWRTGFEQRALASGISQATLDQARPHLTFNAEIIGFDRNQSEFVKAIWTYLDSAVSDTRIANGREKLTQYSALLARLEETYAVDAEIVVAIWGLESAYGAYRGERNILAAMASLAFEGRRRAFFEQQLIAALEILQSGDTNPSAMLGSWAGAMGHTQFIPTSYLAYAVDFDGDGRRDIWSDDPTDALASTAAYLARFGWKQGQPWGVEVQLPRDFDYRLSGRSLTKTVADWRRLGVTPIGDAVVPPSAEASLLLPAGARGVALMVFDNFGVIERYNAADAYVIAVGHLADRLRGAPAFQSAWPREDNPLNSTERRELQQLLTDAGFDTKGIDGLIGPNTIRAIRGFQISAGLVPDGYPSHLLMDKLREEHRE